MVNETAQVQIGYNDCMPRSLILCALTAFLASGAMAAAPRPIMTTENGVRYETFSLRPTYEKAGLTPRSQGKRGTCAVFATLSALEYEWARRNLGKGVKLSAAYLFWAAQKRDFRYIKDSSALEQVVMAAKRYGACLDSLFPYDPATAGQAPPDKTAWDAAKRNVFTASWIKKQGTGKAEGLTDDQVSETFRALKNNHPVVAGVTWRGRGIYHAVTFIGYRKALNGKAAQTQLEYIDSERGTYEYMPLPGFQSATTEAVYFQY